MSQLNGLDNAFRFTLFSAGLTGAAVTGQTTTAVNNVPGSKYLLLQAVISGLDGGTSANFIVQTTVDSSHWTDIASFAFSTGTSAKFHGLIVSSFNNLSQSSGILSANAINQGILGDQFRVFYGTAGTYSAGTVVIVGLAKS